MNKLLLTAAIAVLAGVFQPVPARPAAAAEVGFGQSILPVRFVYLTKQGKIDSVWSNVTAKDDLYIVKFFRSGTMDEIFPSEELLGKYGREMEKSAAKERKRAGRRDAGTESVEFVRGVNLEEIRTII